jgi:nucleoside-diphosphate-sugar epimerase
VLLTGASGFVGSPSVTALLRAGHEVHAVSVRPQQDLPDVTWHVTDLLATDGADALVQTVRPELLLHLAWYAEHGRFWKSVENVRWVEATLRLLRAFARSDGRRAVLAGTCAEYEWTAAGGVLSEAQTALQPDTLYGVAKNATRSVAQALAAETGVELAWGRIFFPYGPGEAPTRLVPSVARALLAGDAAPVTDGSQLRDFLYVDDVAAAFVALLDSGVSGAVNIGSGEAVAVREVVSLVGEVVGRPDLIRFGAVTRRPGEPSLLAADAGRLRDEVGFRPLVPLREGVAKTVAWWQAQGAGAFDSAGARR